MTAQRHAAAAPCGARINSKTSPGATGRRAAHADARWPEIDAALTELRNRHRHAIRIVDADCGCGTLLIEAVHHARAAGFTAIEGRGIDGSPALIGRARAAAARLRDPAIGLEFEVAAMMPALANETELPADILLWHGNQAGDRSGGVVAALAAAGERIIGDPPAASARSDVP